MYTNLLLMFLAAGFIGAAALLVGGLLGPKRAGATKLAAYESGVPASGSARERFPVHFYLVAMLFIIFDIEIHAWDAAGGIQRVELYVDEQLQQTSESDAEGLRDYRVTMNWFAKETGWHKFAVVAYRADGSASHPHIIALEVIPSS